MLLRKLKMLMLLLNVFVASGLVGCGSNDDTPGEQGVTLSGSFGNQAAAQKVSSKVSAMALSDYEVYCVTFSEQPYGAKSQIAEDGSFSLVMPANTAFGCFINLIATQNPVATIAIAGDDSDFGSSASTALQFVGNADLGVLNLDVETGRVLVPRNRVSDVLPANQASSFHPTNVGGRYTMRCLPTGNQYLDQACDDGIASDDGDNDIYFRIMEAQRDGEDIYGIGVWESEQAFQDCGSIDLMNSTIADLHTNENIQFISGGVAGGASFSVGSNCPLRDATRPADHENLELYYAAGELVPDGNGYTLYAHDSHLANAGCRIENTTTVHMTGQSADQLVGQFMIQEQLIDLNNGLGDCSHLTEVPLFSFMVEFTRQ